MSHPDIILFEKHSDQIRRLEHPVDRREPQSYFQNGRISAVDERHESASQRQYRRQITQDPSEHHDSRTSQALAQMVSQEIHVQRMDQPRETLDRQDQGFDRIQTAVGELVRFREYLGGRQDGQRARHRRATAQNAFFASGAHHPVRRAAAVVRGHGQQGEQNGQPNHRHLRADAQDVIGPEQRSEIVGTAQFGPVPGDLHVRTVKTYN